MTPIPTEPVRLIEDAATGDHLLIYKIWRRGAMTPDLQEQERKLKGVRQEVRNLQVMQMKPDQPPEKLKLLAELERSARAEVKLRVKALAYAKSQGKS